MWALPPESWQDNKKNAGERKNTLSPIYEPECYLLNIFINSITTTEEINIPLVNTKDNK